MYHETPQETVGEQWSNISVGGPGSHAGAKHAFDPATVVLADDDPLIAHLLTEALEDEGYRVFSASDGFEAWQLCQRHQPKVVITDVMMPRMDGIELLSRLRDSSGLQQPAMILMSAVPQSISHPDVSFLPKPFDLQDVLDKVAMRLDERSSA
ncbi:MAG TPA: response regulator [Thermomicrobiales bacterium]|nr:response regulator [Thermomicrobiales bacterium]